MDNSEIRAKLELVKKYQSGLLPEDKFVFRLFPDDIDALTDAQDRVYEAITDVDEYYASYAAFSNKPLPPSQKVEMKRLVGVVEKELVALL